MPSQRTPFREVTNAATTGQIQTHVPGPLEKFWSSPVIERSRKRRRVDENEEENNEPGGEHLKVSQTEKTAFSSTATVYQPVSAATSRTALSNFAALKVASTRVNRPRYHPGEHPWLEMSF